MIGPNSSKKLLYLIIALLTLLLIIGCRKTNIITNNDYVNIYVYNYYQPPPIINVKTKYDTFTNINLNKNDNPFIFKLKNEIPQRIIFSVKDTSDIIINFNTLDTTNTTPKTRLLNNNIKIYL